MIEPVWLVVPAYNVEAQLGRLLTQTRQYIPLEKTVVIDDCSTDRTHEIASQFGVMTIRHEQNLGKGRALQTGFDLVRQEGGVWAITIDGDCQHDPESIPDFIDTAENSGLDLLIGSRRRKGSKMPWDRRFSNAVSSLLVSAITWQNLPDVQCGYRMVNLKKLEGLTFRGDRYEFEIELLLKLVKRGARIGWVGIPTRYDGEPSSIRRIPDMIRFLKVVLRYITGTL